MVCLDRMFLLNITSSGFVMACPLLLAGQTHPHLPLNGSFHDASMIKEISFGYLGVQ